MGKTVPNPERVVQRNFGTRKRGFGKMNNLSGMKDWAMP
jgi:hypothetical protein